MISEDLFTYGNRAEILTSATAARLPAIGAYRQFVDAGAMLSYGSGLVERTRELGRYAGRVLRGAKPAELPVDRPTRFELVVSEAAARRLGVTVPETLLMRADEVLR